MIKDETGQRNKEEGTNEDREGLLRFTRYRQAEQRLFVILMSVDFQLVFLFCCFVHISYHSFFRDFGFESFCISNSNKMLFLKHTRAHTLVTND